MIKISLLYGIKIDYRSRSITECSVSKVCWTTTEAFNELYKTSKEVQEKFLDSLVKVECDPIDSKCSDNNKATNNSVQEESIEADRIKEGQNLGEVVDIEKVI